MSHVGRRAYQITVSASSSFRDDIRREVIAAHRDNLRLTELDYQPSSIWQDEQSVAIYRDRDGTLKVYEPRVSRQAHNSLHALSV